MNTLPNKFASHKLFFFCYAESSSSSATPGKKTLPPVNHKKVNSALKNMPKQESWKVITCGSSSTSTSTKEQPDTNLVATIDELQKKIDVLQQTKSANLQKLLQLIEQNKKDVKPQVLLKNLKETRTSLRKLLSENESFESKLKELTTSCSKTTAIEESSPTKFDGRAVSNTTTNLPSSSQVHLNTVAPAPSSEKVVRFNPLPTENVRAQSCHPDNEIGLPLRHSSALRRFLLAPSASTSSRSERRLNEMRRVERESHEPTFGKRPRAAHHSRIRSVTQNIQEYLPYECEHLDSDSEEESSVSRKYIRQHPGNEGMRKFELTQCAAPQTTRHRENIN